MAQSDSTIDHSKSKKDRTHMRMAMFWEILWDAVNNYRQNGDVNQAAAIALYAILSLIPMIILSLIAAGYFFSSNPDIQNTILVGLQDFHSSFSRGLMNQLGQIDVKIKVLGWVGIISLIWLSSAIFSTIETAFNLIFRSSVGRNYFLSKLLAIAMIPLGWAIGIAGVSIAYIGEVVANIPPLFGDEELFIFTMARSALFRYILPYLLMVLYFAIVYKFIPTKKIRFIEAVAASALFSALMELARQLFAWYITHNTSYNVIFGSLEAVVILVLWVLYMALILLFCAELIASTQRRNLILLEKALLKSKDKLLMIDARLFRKFGKFYHKGDYVFREGDVGSEMYYILSGRVRLEKRAGQVTKTLTEMTSGNYFGEMAALIEQSRAATAHVMEESSIAVVSGETFRSLIRESVDVSLLMLKEFSSRIMHTNASLEECTQALIKMTVVFYFFREWPLEAYRNPLNELVERTEKNAGELWEVLSELGKQGVVTIEGDRVTGFSREEAWKLWCDQALI